jgi:flagellar basal-body rod modification protein FlgD
VSTTAVGSTASTATTPEPAKTKQQSLGKDAFLQLLVTQMTHQDPTEPKADGEFIAQLAQFSSLEQLTEIQKTLAAMSTALGVDPTTLQS